MRALWTWMAMVAVLLAGSETASAEPSDSSAAATDHGRDAAVLPFSAADLGWVLVAAALLLVLAISLQLLARRRRRRAMRSVARERTDP